MAYDAEARYYVPASGQLRNTWTGKAEEEPFDDSLSAGWQRGPQGLGFDLETDQKVEVPTPYAYWTFDGDIEDRSEFKHVTTNSGATFSNETPPLIGDGQSLRFNGGEFVSALIDVGRSQTRRH